MHKDEYQLRFFMCVFESRHVVRTSQSTGTIDHVTVIGDEFSQPPRMRASGIMIHLRGQKTCFIFLVGKICVTVLCVLFVEYKGHAILVPGK